MNRILVVEDEADMAATYERLLRRAGHRVVTVDTLAAGLQLLKSERPKLVISDLRLPDGDGLDIVRAACSLDPPSPVILVTAFASRAAREAAVEAGARAFVAKPFGIVEFSRLIEGLIDHS